VLKVRVLGKKHTAPSGPQDDIGISTREKGDDLIHSSGSTHKEVNLGVIREGDYKRLSSQGWPLTDSEGGVANNFQFDLVPKKGTIRLAASTEEKRGGS